MARRTPRSSTTLEVCITFEPSRVSPACVAQAYERVAPTTWGTVFVVRLSRGGDVARELLGAMCAGILVPDAGVPTTAPQCGGANGVGRRCGVPQTEGVCRELLKRRQALWTFVHLAGVEPTTNAAERAIRPGVLWRKGRFGTPSDQGSRFVALMMRVVTTLKQQQRNVLESLPAACEAALRHALAPSLLPESHVAPSDQIAP